MEWRLLSGLSAEDRRDLLKLAHRRRFKRGEPVFHEGDPGDTLHLIDSGHAAARVTTPLGDTATLLVLGPGDSFGELAIVAPGPRNSSVVPLDPMETLAIHQNHLAEFRATHSSLDAALMQNLVQEVRRLSHLLLESHYVPAEKRVLRRLLEVAEVYDGAEVAPTMPLTQDDVAQLAGTTRQTANSALGAAQDVGAIKLGRGRVQILDRILLEKRAR